MWPNPLQNTFGCVLRWGDPQNGDFTVYTGKSSQDRIDMDDARGYPQDETETSFCSHRLPGRLPFYRSRAAGPVDTQTVGLLFDDLGSHVLLGGVNGWVNGNIYKKHQETMDLGVPLDRLLMRCFCVSIRWYSSSPSSPELPQQLPLWRQMG